MFRRALNREKCEDAKAELFELRKWRESINPSAARSLNEAFDEIVNLHKLEVAEGLRRVLSTTNDIENVFSVVRHREKNL